jgi:hypothetical protein
VFASSIAPKAKGVVAARSRAGRGGLADPWSGYDASAAQPASVPADQTAAAEQSGGLGSTLGAGLAILGFGLAGLIGSFLIAGVRRRRAQTHARGEGEGQDA